MFLEPFHIEQVLRSSRGIMRNWLKSYQSANVQTKLFVWICVLFGLAIILSTVYPYARLFEPFS